MTPKNRKPAKKRDILMLCLRNLIAEKEVVVCTMNYEANRYGEWCCDHPACIRQINAEIDDTVKQIDELDRAIRAAKERK